jgi:hypothetical protein
MEITMSPERERRKSGRSAEEAVSPEYLALLALCGGEVREGDRPSLEKRRKAGGRSSDTVQTAEASDPEASYPTGPR